MALLIAYDLGKEYKLKISNTHQLHPSYGGYLAARRPLRSILRIPSTFKCLSAYCSALILADTSVQFTTDTINTC